MSRSVLIVDDDAGLRQLYRMALDQEGYEVTEASNGAEALREVMSRTPDVIIMDMLMPMLGGEAVMKRIQQMPTMQNVKIIVVTAYPRFRESAEFMRADQFLIKPVKPDDVLKAIKAVFGD
jgi:CheY-like chemotaxis protein